MLPIGKNGFSVMSSSPSVELKAFEATARSGSISAAARLLGVRQPTVSAHLSNLENRYGVELFHRSRRGVVLTEFGKLLHEATTRIYLAEQQAMLLLLSARCHYQGHLRIGAIGPYNVMPMITLFRSRHPQVRVSVSIGDSKVITQRVLAQEDDVGIVLNKVDSDQMTCLPFRRQRLIVFAATNHPLASKSNLEIKDLEGHEFILREEGSRTRSVFEEGLLAAGVSVRTSVEMGSREAVREAVAQGLGLGVVAQTAFTSDERLVALPVTGLDLYTHPHVICLKERSEAALISRFVQMAKELKSEGLG